MKVSAQLIPAPDPICVSKDTILWNLPNVTCGPIDIYEIYVSNNLNGPYQLLVVVVNPMQDEYYHRNTNGETRYYYMRTIADCPGRQSAISDTINNIPPPKVPISYVTVENGNVRIVWEKSTNAKVEGYVIYKSTSSGTIPIDTVMNATFYIDTDADVMNKSEYYYILSIDKCGNPSLYDVVHRSIYLEASVDSCARTITLTWNAYEGWGDALRGYEIYSINNTGRETLLGSVGADLRSFTVKNILDDRRYCYKVRATHENNLWGSSSQELCIDPAIVQPITYNEIYKVNVLLNGDVEVYWEWNQDAQLSEVTVPTSQASTGKKFSIPFPVISSISSMEMVIDVLNDASNGAVIYSVHSIDFCDSTTSSPEVNSIYLTARTLPNFNIGMTWTEFNVKNTSNIEYFIERIINNTVVETIPLSNADNSYQYPFDPTDLGIYESCFRLGVNYTYTFQDGSSQGLVMYSSLACPSFDIKIQVPTAMVYHGVNSEFRPLFLVPELIDNYSLEIFSRYGEKVFISHEVTHGWDGTDNGRLLPQGIYIYKITAEKRDKQKVLQGYFTLLH